MCEKEDVFKRPVNSFMFHDARWIKFKDTALELNAFHATHNCIINTVDYTLAWPIIQFLNITRVLNNKFTFE